MFLVISSITNALKSVVTVTTPNSYIVDQLLYFSVPFSYGMFQINGLTAQIIDVDDTNLIFTVALNTLQFDPFVAPTGAVEKPATVSPAGSRNQYNVTTVPFHSEGNFGN